MNAYRISTGKRLGPDAPISVRRNGLWQRAFFQRVLDTSTIEGVFDGDLVVRFEGTTDDSYIRPGAAHDVMVRS